MSSLKIGGGGFSTINFFAKNTFWIMESHLFFNGSIVAFFTGVIGSAIFVCIIRFGQKKVRLLSNKYLNNIV